MIHVHNGMNNNYKLLIYNYIHQFTTSHMNAYTLIPSSNDLFSILLTEWSGILILSSLNVVGK